MAAAAACRRAPIYMLNRYADMSQLTGEPDPGEGWVKMECDSIKAYAGCGENIQEAVKGLAIYVRLGDHPLITSSLAIRMTDEALGRFNKEFEEEEFDEETELFHRQFDSRPRFQPKTTTAWARILVHAEDLMFISLVFGGPGGYSCNHAFDLVYDRKRASLSVIKPPDVPAVALKPVLGRRTSNGGDYELVHMAIDVDVFSRFNMKRPDPFLCVFSPAASAAWEMRRVGWHVPADVDKRFRGDMTFSFQGKCFWVDLSQGLEYCDLNTAAAIVDFSYCPLPHQCVLDFGKVLDLERPMEAIRTVACDDRDSIWFVCIDENMLSPDDCADNLVSMWTLKLEAGHQWKNEARFSLRDLWRFDGFKEAGLPEARVGYPHLNAVDGVLHLMLSGEYSKEEKNCWVDHVCSFDVRNKKLLWHGTVHDVALLQPAAIPSGFFQNDLQMKQSPCNMSSAEDCQEDCQDAGLMAMPGRVRWMVQQIEAISCGRT